MTIGEYIQRIQSLYSKGVQSDDSRLSNRHIYDTLLSLRTKLITEKANKKQKISQWNYQTLPCVEMIEVPLNECPCLPPLGCTIYRSKHKIPQPLHDLTRHMISTVSSVDGQIRFNEVDYKELNYKSSSRYTSKKPDYFIRDEYLYISKVTENIPVVLFVEGVFQDPTAVINFESYCAGEELIVDDCTNIYDKPFPLDLDMKETVIEMAANQLVIFFSKNLEDKSNDTRDSPEEQSK